MKTRNQQKGASVIEMLIYVSVLTMLVLAITSVLFTVAKSHRKAQSAKLVQSNALFSIDRMSKEIHNARSVDLTQSTLNANPGRLTLNSIDTAGATKTVEFYVQNSILKIKENGIYKGQMTASTTQVSSLVFRHIDQTASDAVRLEMQVSAGADDYSKSENFYTTIILRDSY